MLLVLALIVAISLAVMSYAAQARQTAMIALAQDATEHTIRRMARGLAGMPYALARSIQGRTAAHAHHSARHASLAYLVGCAMARVERANACTVHAASVVTDEFAGVQ